MKNVLVAGVAVICALVAGCQSGSASERHKKEQLETMESLTPMLDAYMQNLQPWRHIGIAEIRMRPSGGSLYIDGGEYVGGEKEIRLPIGAYEFKAVWPDGREVMRKIFVEAALGDDGTVNMGWNETGGRFNWKIKPDFVMTKTPVELVRP